MLRSLIISILLSAAAVGAHAAEGNETVKINGDFRYRHENTDQEGKEPRTRHRIRARLALTATLEENLKLHFQLVSGSDEPLSTNQTLDGAATTKDFRLDRAYFAWQHIPSSLSVLGGKMKNPFLTPGKTELIWDGDLSPEGLAASYTKESEKTEFFLTGSSFWVDERSSAQNSTMAGVQAGLTHKLDGSWFRVGSSYYELFNLTGPLYNDNFFGNTPSDTLWTDDDNFIVHYANEFKMLEIFAEFGFNTQGIPVVFFADFVSNYGADTDDQGYLFGMAINKAKKPGSWTLKYNYREVQPDAVLGASTDSDFIGGGTNGKGHEMSFVYQVAAQAQLALSYFANKIDLDEERDYKRLQVDLKFKF